jgi:hypothetical protein
MKGKSTNFSGSDSNMTIVFVLVAVIIIIIAIFICLNLNKKSSNQESFDNKTYTFRTARAGHGMAVGVLENSGVEKDVSEKQKINAVQCPVKDDKGVKRKGFWVCNEVEYEDGRKRAGCGCLYGTKYNDPLNLFYDIKYKETDDGE